MNVKCGRHSSYLFIERYSTFCRDISFVILNAFHMKKGQKKSNALWHQMAFAVYSILSIFFFFLCSKQSLIKKKYTKFAMRRCQWMLWICMHFNRMCGRRVDNFVHRKPNTLVVLMVEHVVNGD